MTTKDPEQDADPLSATGMFLNAFRTQPNPPQEPPKESLTPPSPAPAEPGEFTQMFIKPVVPAPVPAPVTQPAEEATRIFVRQASTPPARMKGFSSPGASDSASDDGSLSQLFRTAPALPLPAKPLGATDLFQVRPTAEPPKADPVPETGSVTSWIRKLSENIEPIPTAKVFEADTPARTVAPGQGEYTRIISGDARKPSSPVPAAGVVQSPAVEPPKVAAPKVAPPAAAAPQSKLQEMLPILLVLNGFLLLVLIVLVVFVLLRK